MFRRALTMARRDGNHFLEAVMLLNLGVVALHRQRYQEALAMLEEARGIASRLGAKLLLEKSMGNSGFAMYGLGDFLSAQDSFRSAQREATLVNSPIDGIQWLTNEGLSAARMGDVRGAQQAYERSMQQAQALNMLEEIGDAHEALGLLLIDKDTRSAAEHIREFARISGIRQNKPDQLDAGLLQAMLWARTGEMARAARSLAMLDAEKELAPSLRWQAEQELARVNVRMGREAIAEVWFRRAIGTFHQQRVTLDDVESALPFLENGTDLYSDYVQYLVERGRTEEALRVVDQSRAESLSRGIAGRVGMRGPADARSRQRMAAAVHGAILVYYVLPRESYLWVTTADRTGFFRIAGGTELSPLIRAQRRAILAAKDLLADPDAAGRQLFAKLVGPAQPLLRPGERVFLVGDGPLSELNFETLVSSEGAPHFWIDDAMISNVPSLRLMPSARRAVSTSGLPRRMLLLGDPRYAKGEYDPLPRAAEEVDDVKLHFAPASRLVLTGAEATPAAYRAGHPEQFTYIHFVAHSTANANKPLDSSVILSPNEDGVDKLYAREIVGAPLRAELVTISGCYSSGSRVYAGEGAVGLAWAFERAGARNVIGTLWEVNDASTPALMNRLYTRLLNGAPPDEALREAKLSLLHSQGVFRKALYWAPFQLYSSS